MQGKETIKLEIKWPQEGNEIRTKAGMAYIVGKPIGAGAYSLVYEGIDLFGNLVALKIFKPANRPFKDVQNQWERETQLFRKLRHPNIVAIYDAFICDNLFYIVLEKAWGNLCDWVQIVKPVAESAVKEMARQLLFAIHFIHRERVLQRDITIYNTLVFHGPEPIKLIFKISDFGISKECFEPVNPLIYPGKTAHRCFIPPELLLPQYGYTNEQSDLYHLGLVLLYSLIGTLPFDMSMNDEERNKMIIDGVPRMEAEKIGTSLGNFISILLRRHRESRFQTALDAWKALRSLPVPQKSLFDEKK